MARTCTVCQDQTSKYTCPGCRTTVYCSVPCYKLHKESCSTRIQVENTPTSPAPKVPQDLQDPTPLRPLTSLKWPYVPDTSAYPDPLTRDDPKPLQLHQYEAIATSPTIRAILVNPRLRANLASIDALRGSERVQALERALGVDARLVQNTAHDHGPPLDDDTLAFRALAEAVEEAVRGGRDDALGLDWEGL